MFRCQMCQQVVPAGTRSAKITVATRPRTYASRGADPAERRFRRGPAARKKTPYDKGGTGTEIVQELTVCPDCDAKHETPAAEEE